MSPFSAQNFPMIHKAYVKQDTKQIFYFMHIYLVQLILKSNYYL